ncbi:hypothetical protein ABW20_dc0103016 [Dactylellina cionopaga]|nr:hypothetical protein ABW20_dc0103016 [Dactylellina cionopaga]
MDHVSFPILYSRVVARLYTNSVRLFPNLNSIYIPILIPPSWDDLESAIFLQIFKGLSENSNYRNIKTISLDRAISRTEYISEDNPDPFQGYSRKKRHQNDDSNLTPTAVVKISYPPNVEEITIRTQLFYPTGGNNYHLPSALIVASAPTLKRLKLFGEIDNASIRDESILPIFPNLERLEIMSPRALSLDEDYCLTMFPNVRELTVDRTADFLPCQGEDLVYVQLQELRRLRKAKVMWPKAYNRIITGGPRYSRETPTPPTLLGRLQVEEMIQSWVRAGLHDLREVEFTRKYRKEPPSLLKPDNPIIVVTEVCELVKTGERLELRWEKTGMRIVGSRLEKDKLE